MAGDIAGLDLRIRRRIVPGDFGDRHRRFVNVTASKHQAHLALERLASVLKSGIDHVRPVPSDALAGQIPL